MVLTSKCVCVCELGLGGDRGGVQGEGKKFEAKNCIQKYNNQQEK